MQRRRLLPTSAWLGRIYRFHNGLSVHPPAQPLNGRPATRCRYTDANKPGSSTLLRQRFSWYRHAFRFNRRRLLLHLSLVGGFLGTYLYFLREHLEPYLPKAIQPPGAPPLDPTRFRRFDLASRTPFSSTSSILRLTVHGPKWLKSAADYEETWMRGVWSVDIKQPQLQIARPYTPLPPRTSSSGDGEIDGATDLRFLIRRERQGEVSGYLHRLAEGSNVEVRGPHVEFALPQHVDEVVFLAGGTGIAPAMQIAYAMLRSRAPQNDNAGAATAAAAAAPDPGRKRLRILWASRTREDAFGVFGTDEQPGPIVQQLRSMAAQGRAAGTLDLEAECFVDEERKFITERALSAALAPATAGTAAPDAAAAGPSKLILLSGPDGFVGYLAGPKVLRNGLETQGPLAGLLSRMDLRGWAVWKL